MPPQWAIGLPEHIQLTSYQIERLELIRAAVGVPELEFRLHVRSHPECTKMLQRQQYQRAKVSEPGMPEEYYLLAILLQRLQTARLAGGDLFGLRSKFPDSTSLDDQAVVAAAVELIRTRRWTTIEDLAEGIVEYEADLTGNVPPHPSTAEASRQVTLILRESARLP